MANLNALIGICVFSAVFFLIILGKPSKNTFIVTTALFIAYMAYNFYAVSNTRHTPDGMGKAIGMLILTAVSGVVLTGILAKCAWLYLASKNISRKKRVAAILLILALTFGSAAFYLY